MSILTLDEFSILHIIDILDNKSKISFLSCNKYLYTLKNKITSVNFENNMQTVYKFFPNVTILNIFGTLITQKLSVDVDAVSIVDILRTQCETIIYPSGAINGTMMLGEGFTDNLSHLYVSTSRTDNQREKINKLSTDYYLIENKCYVYYSACDIKIFKLPSEFKLLINNNLENLPQNIKQIFLFATKNII
jgi:hypothetical protein